ncbi:hypothetical protein ADIS_0087 [Lunatimonas lonarensis]|uniref:Sensory/regulatory protein RpfC n=1 Tax=Lunatimonas lonarensis TaxID=1232681 RepID=R7ZZ74_9BACT|nr:histidine kinase N-terminal 7TM domain-containing protein [Lunatimonas lonarensis]EON79397.1 hypothetical protein ADIS_0087 [Lunatimonas lonarensis]
MGIYFSLNGVVVWMLVSGIIPLLLALSAGKLRKSKEVTFFVFLMISSAVYSLGYAFELASVGLPQKVFFLNLQYFGAVFFGPVLFLMVWHYSGSSAIPWIQRLVFVVPLITLVLVFTNGKHYLFYTSYSAVHNDIMDVLVTTKGPIYWAHQAYTVILLVASQIVLVRMLVLGTVTDARQIYFVGLGALCPILAYFSLLSDIVPFHLDPIPLSFIGTGVFVFLGLSKFRLFKETPIVFKTLFESIADGVLVLDPMDRIVSYNPAVSEMVGGFASKAEKRAGVQSLWDRISPGFSEEDRKKHSFKWEGSGSERWYSATLSAIRVRNAEFLGKIVVIRDITQEVESREALVAAKTEAEQANQAKSEFLANMSHEIRTPLNGVIGFTELLGNTALSEQQKRYVTTAFSSANVLLDLINNVLDLSKIEAGKMDLDIQEVNLRQVIRGIADVMSFQAAKDNIEFVLRISPDVPYKFLGDEVKIKQVLINLLNNAFKFTHAGEVELRIGVLDRVADKVRLRFEVRDTGIGIPDEKQQMIFEAFSQADASTTKKYGGTGLGLTISNKLLGLMNSTLMLDSQAGKGSVFSFELPNIVSLKESPFIDKSFSDYSPALLVGFEGALAETLQFFLHCLSIQYTSVSSYDEALGWLSKHPGVRSLFSHVRKNEEGGVSYEVRDFVVRLGPAFRNRCCIVFPTDTPEVTFSQFQTLGCRKKLIKPFMLMDLVDQFEKWTVSDNPTDLDGTNRILTPTNVKMKVLVAEDNAVNRMLVKVYLSNLFPAFTVIEAENGVDAYDLYEKERPDLVITDLHMPDMNGYELVRKIRAGENTRRIPILALTANVMEGQEEACKEAGVDDYITKPVRQETFRTVLEKWLR